MLKQAVAVLILAVAGLPAQAAPAAGWRVQQACAMQRYLRATPAFASAWGRDAAQVSLGSGSPALRRRDDPEARARFDTAMRSGRAFADRAAAQLAAREGISQEDATRRIGADPGPWPAVTPVKCEALERRAETKR
ncbi:hypothetical protein M9M90_15175 [Phenylobacterium sp. LH3H17]|uniref:hypothetical protein n=1 Tax=Phenylobacterium sp. LH3H17 TaxID=2903901 RepID=UPI0020C9AD8D|nr:hypothetical protein [Phenylobacterium sp. LH3H17]UTP38552.1 hypothetical protein M9M90_15175 [Phenylobacterium sp. LH3H17]